MLHIMVILLRLYSTEGQKDVDVVFVDILETIKVGDTVELYDDYPVYDEDPRLVVDITATDTLETNVYPGPGISTDLSYERALQWCRQTEDLIINDQPVAKDREIYKALVNPGCYPSDVGVGDTTIYVESVKTFFDSHKENAKNLIENTIEIVGQAVCAAAATAVVSAAGTISSIILTDPVTQLWNHWCWWCWISCCTRCIDISANRNRYNWKSRSNC